MSEKKIIQAQPDSFGTYLKKIWAHKALIVTFAKRDLKAKYAQTILGIGWSILHPAVILFLFTFFFGYLLHWKTGNTPFALYVYSGLLGWNLFSYIVIQGNNSLTESAHIIKKVYFPKLILPLSKVLVGLVELCISLLLLIGLMIWYGYVPSWKIIFLPIVILITLIPAIIMVSWIGALSYRIRDLFHVVPFLMYAGIWITPVFFTMDILPKEWQSAWSVNPMTGIIEAWRWCLFPDWKYNTDHLPAVLFLLPLCIGGIWLYSRNESSFSDFA